MHTMHLIEPPDPYHIFFTPTHIGVQAGRDLVNGFTLVSRTALGPSTVPDPRPPSGYYSWNGELRPLPDAPPEPEVPPTPEPSETLYAWVRRIDGGGIDAFHRVDCGWVKVASPDGRWNDAPTYSGDYLPCS